MEIDENFAPTNIIVRMPNWIGDSVMATPVLGDLRRAFPKAKITVMCLKNMASCFSQDQDVDEMLTFTRPSSRRGRQEIVSRIRAKNFDFGLLLTNSFSSAWWFWKAGVRIRSGFARDARRFFLTHPVAVLPGWQSYHQVDVYKMLLQKVGIPKSRTRPRLFCSNEEMARADALLNEYEVFGDNLIGINATAAYGSAKCWLPERFVEVAKRLAEHKRVRICFFGDKSNIQMINEMCEGLPANVINLAGKTTLKQLVCIIKRCRVLLTNDSGPMHIAAAVGTPLVALFGSTNDVLTGPYTNKAVVINKRVDCAPCYLRTCPIDFRCMKQIESDEVYQEVIRWVEKPEEVLSSSYVHEPL